MARQTAPTAGEITIGILAFLLGVLLPTFCAAARHGFDVFWGAVEALGVVATFVVAWRALHSWREQRDAAFAADILVTVHDTCRAIKEAARRGLAVLSSGATKPEAANDYRDAMGWVSQSNALLAKRRSEARVHFGVSAAEPLEALAGVETKLWQNLLFASEYSADPRFATALVADFGKDFGFAAEEATRLETAIVTEFSRHLGLTSLAVDKPQAPTESQTI